MTKILALLLLAIVSTAVSFAIMVYGWGVSPHSILIILSGYLGLAIIRVVAERVE